MLLAAWAAAAAPESTVKPQEAPASALGVPVQRLIFASAGFTESNRFWTIGRADHLQFDPFLETLLDVDPKTGAFTPRLAERWRASPDLKEWTFFLRKGVSFHFGFGELTAKDVVHSHSLMLRPDATATLAGFWRSVEAIEVIDDHQLVFRLKQPMATMPYAASRAGDLRIVSKAQWVQEGLAGLDRRPAGTGSYRYVKRQLGQSLLMERVEHHWRGEAPDFKELEIRLVREDATRMALLFAGEAHIVDLSRELHKEALKRGMQIISSQLPADWMTVYFGGQYHIPGDPKFNPHVPWNDIKVRQAMNMAINRQELQEALFAGKGTWTYVSGFLPTAEGWNPEWERRFPERYGYNPVQAMALLQEAGYRPGTLKVKILTFVDPGEAEALQLAEALAIYFNEVDIETEIEALDVAKVTEMWRTKKMHCCIWPNLISWRPTAEWIRISYLSQGPAHHFEHPFIEEKYLALTQAVDPQERDRLAREIGEFLFEHVADIPLFWLTSDVVVNPKVVAAWTYPGIGAGRTTHFHLLKATK
jgi:peptide/nickel transport system substrate-binding protein